MHFHGVRPSIGGHWKTVLYFLLKSFLSRLFMTLSSVCLSLWQRISAKNLQLSFRPKSCSLPAFSSLLQVSLPSQSAIQTVQLDAGTPFMHVDTAQKTIPSKTPIEPQKSFNCTRRRNIVVGSLSSNLCSSTVVFKLFPYLFVRQSYLY